MHNLTTRIEQAVVLDKIDRNILAIMQVNCRVSTDAIAEDVGLSPSAVQRRLNRLRKLKVITEEVAVISPEAIGRPLVLIIEVTLEREDQQSVTTFRKRMINAPEVMQFYFVTGSSDYVLIFSAESIEAYEEFIQREFLDNQIVSYASTKVVMKPLKVGLKLPIE